MSLQPKETCCTTSCLTGGDLRCGNTTCFPGRSRWCRDQTMVLVPVEPGALSQLSRASHCAQAFRIHERKEVRKLRDNEEGEGGGGV